MIEVDRYEVHAGIHVRLRHVGRAPCIAPAPRAAMQEHIDGRIRRAGGVDVEPFDLGRAVRHALRLSEPRESRLALLGVALRDLLLVRRPGCLVVRVIDLFLVVVEKDAGAFRLGRHARRDVSLHRLREQRPRGDRNRGCERALHHRPSRGCHHAATGRCARKNDRIWRTASGMRSFGSFHGNMLTSAFGASMADSIATAYGCWGISSGRISTGVLHWRTKSRVTVKTKSALVRYIRVRNLSTLSIVISGRRLTSSGPQFFRLPS